MDSLFSVETTIEKRDYRKCMYSYAFILTKFKLYLIIAPILASVVINYILETDSIKYFIFNVIVVFILIVIAVSLKLEYQINRLIKTDKFWNATRKLDFYKDYLIKSISVIEGYSKIKYEQYYKVIEMKEYFLCFYNIQLVLIIRKKDMESETCDKLRDIFKEEMGKKYRKINI
ncbi:YcxB family protein [Anaeromicrobium sediminis]|uniref:Uncharacterized protein n=1 Tax=Anaeromicrobium sediminis TaxID=1478221 RepID=A0A267MNP0_9FIRM|nr:YcxB family protein [Anaeromicrobium sediminis]PAB61156.1 hypothetical protein CCE28_01655 [Anaeromicrobium sediminis]